MRINAEARMLMEIRGVMRGMLVKALIVPPLNECDSSGVYVLFVVRQSKWAHRRLVDVEERA